MRPYLVHILIFCYIACFVCKQITSGWICKRFIQYRHKHTHSTVTYMKNTHIKYKHAYKNTYKYIPFKQGFKNAYMIY